MSLVWKPKYGYDNKLSGETLLSEKIKLPSKNNKPDWEWITRFIKPS
jgi:hypothetical protein